MQLGMYSDYSRLHLVMPLVGPVTKFSQYLKTCEENDCSANNVILGSKLEAMNTTQSAERKVPPELPRVTTLSLFPATRLTTPVGSSASQPVLFGQVVEMLPVHSGLSCCGTDISVVSLQKPRYVAALKIGLKRAARLAIAQGRVEVSGSSRCGRSTVPTSQSRCYVKCFRTCEIAIHSSEGVGCPCISVCHLHSPGEGEKAVLAIEQFLVLYPQCRPAPSFEIFVSIGTRSLENNDSATP